MNLKVLHRPPFLDNADTMRVLVYDRLAFENGMNGRETGEIEILSRSLCVYVM